MRSDGERDAVDIADELEKLAERLYPPAVFLAMVKSFKNKGDICAVHYNAARFHEEGLVGFAYDLPVECIAKYHGNFDPEEVVEWASTQDLPGISITFVKKANSPPRDCFRITQLIRVPRDRRSAFIKAFSMPASAVSQSSQLYKCAQINVASN